MKKKKHTDYHKTDFLIPQVDGAIEVSENISICKNQFYDILKLCR